MFETMWEKIKTWASVTFGPVGTIINARLTMIAGFVTGAIGLMDWSPLLNFFGTNTAFNQTQVVALGAITFVKGIIDEITRRANDPMLKITQAVEAAPAVTKAKAEVQKIVDKTPQVKNK